MSASPASAGAPGSGTPAAKPLPAVQRATSWRPAWTHTATGPASRMPVVSASLPGGCVHEAVRFSVPAEDDEKKPSLLDAHSAIGRLLAGSIPTVWANVSPPAVSS